MTNHEWHYYIGGNCALKERNQNKKVVARIEHVEQGVYEAILVRREEKYHNVKDYFPLGTFNNETDAMKSIERVYGYA